MPRNKPSNRSRRKQQVNRKLAGLFKLSQEQLATRKTTGGGLHRTVKDMPRGEQKRRAIDEQRD